MSVQVLAAAPDAEVGALLPAVRSVTWRNLAPGEACVVPLSGRTALVYVQFGVLTVAGHNAERALPGEWLRVVGMAELALLNSARSEQLKVLEIVFAEQHSEAEPQVEQRYVSDDEKADRLCPVASAGSDSDGIAIADDAFVYIAALGRWSTVLHDLKPDRGALVWVLLGEATVNSQKLESGDCAFITNVDEVRVAGGAGADIVLLEAAAVAPES